MPKIGFHLNRFCERGTSIAVYDYASYTSNPVIFSPKNSNHDQQVILKFRLKFKVILYESEQLEKLIEDLDVKYLYTICYGHPINIKLPENVKHMVHCIFDSSIGYGDIYACVSNELNLKYKTNYPVVPHMINMPVVKGNLRKELSIPEDYIVFGRYGGYDSFDIPDVHKAISRVLCNRNDCYFLFANTKPFINNHRVIYLSKIVNLEDKVKFIQTCDAHIHARNDGETFGLTIGEFSINGVPTITSSIHGYQNHSRILGQNGYYYQDEESCFNILVNFHRINNYTDLYSEYTPEKVMPIFNRVFLDSKFVMHQNFRFMIYSNDRLSQCLLRNENWEPYVTKFYELLLKENSIVVEAGAGFGYHTLLMSRLVPKGRVIAFEPQLENYQLLEINTYKSFNVDINNKALGPNFDQLYIPIIDTSVSGNYGDVSIYTQQIAKTRAINCLTLDSLSLNKLDLIIIRDYEYHLLLGSNYTLKFLRPIIIMELDDYKLINYNTSSIIIIEHLKELGYYWFFLEHHSKYIAVHNSKIKSFVDIFDRYINKLKKTDHNIKYNINLF